MNLKTIKKIWYLGWLMRIVNTLGSKLPLCFLHETNTMLCAISEGMGKRSIYQGDETPLCDTFKEFTVLRRIRLTWV